MHSKIFQITKDVVDKQNLLNENTIEQGDGEYYDYCSEISEEERKEHIAYLVDKILPKHMFELIGEDTIRYLGGAEKWKAEYVSLIQQKTSEITTENCTEVIGPVYQLEKVIKNPLRTGYQFYMDKEGLQGYAEQSAEFMCMVCGLQTGDLLHIGGVIDYHY